MSLPLSQIARIGAYTLKQHIKGGKYPLVLMLEPLLRCNLACPGCGKIDYPDAILNQPLVVSSNAWTRSMRAARPPCRSPAASRCCTATWPAIVKGYISRKKKFVILCTNALLLKKKIDEYQPVAVFHLVDPSRWRPADA